jgi:hypothetical protein
MINHIIAIVKLSVSAVIFAYKTIKDFNEYNTVCNSIKINKRAIECGKVFRQIEIPDRRIKQTNDRYCY